MSHEVMGEKPFGWRWLLLVIVSGVALSAGAHRYLALMEQQALRAAFETEAHDQVALVGFTLNRAVDAVLATADLLHLYPDIAPRDFARIAGLTLDRQPNLASLGVSRWIADEMGQHYLVASHIAPAMLAADVIGVDVMSRPNRRDAVLAARDAGLPRMTGPLQLGGRPADDAGVLVFAPLYRDGETPSTLEARRSRFVGTVSLGLLIEPMLRAVMPLQAPSPVRAVVVDRDAAPGRSILFDQLNPGTGRLGTDLAALAADPLAVWDTVEIAGRRWDVLSVPTAAFRAQRFSSMAPLLALVMGLVITALAAGLAALLLQHNRTMRRNLLESEAAAGNLARANEALQRANREMEEFVSAVSHDLRNPLQTLVTVGQLLQRSLDGDDVPGIRRGAASLERATRTMRRIVDGLLEHSRAGWAPMPQEPVDLTAIARRLVAECAEAPKIEGTRIDVLDLPTLQGDAQRLTAALDNLLGNALKHGGKRSGGRPASVKIGCRLRPDEVQVFVSDNGSGIPEEHRERLFQLFQRLDGSSDGTGFGLAIVERAVRAHDGRVWIEETPGGGTTVVMAFPRSRLSGEADT